MIKFLDWFTAYLLMILTFFHTQKIIKIYYMHYALKVSFLHLMCFCVFYLKNVIRLILVGHVIPRLNIGSYASGSRFIADHVGKFWQTLGYVVFTKFSPFLSRYCIDITDLRSKIGFSDLFHLILIKICPD